MSIAGANPSEATKELPIIAVRMEDSASDFETINHWVKDGSLKPVLDKTYPLQNTVDAFLYLETGRARGKVVITF